MPSMAPAFAGVEKEAEIVEHLAAGLGRDLADRRIGGEGTMEKDPGLVGVARSGETGDGREWAGHADGGTAAFEDRAIADNNDAHARRHRPLGHQPGDDFRSDAGAITQKERQDFRHFPTLWPRVRGHRNL